MNLKEVLKMADEIVFAKTGKHLDDLQEAILRGTIQGEKYTKIADEIHCNESYVRDVGSKLWQILSEELGEDVSKTNFRSAIQRFQVSLFSNVVQDHVRVGNINFCGEARHPPNIPNSHSPNQETSHHELSEMPELGAFYDRTSELKTLTTSILQQNSRLITITGGLGIGKTSLAIQLVQQIKDEFEYVIWCNLDTSPTLGEFEANLIQFLSQSQKQESPTTNQKALPLIKYLQKHRCLIVLDDIHNLFSSSELAGKYKPGYEEYRSLFRILQLTGLDSAAAREILRDKGLTEIENWETLIHCYQGNPLWLKSVATLMQELGIGAAELLLNDTVLLPEDLKDVLHQQFSRLSEIEKQVLCLFCRESEPVNLAKLLEYGTVRSPDLLNALLS
ncbi:MAG: NACHT domain-containing protein [Microcoleus sp. PH2017_06_SFM_O_A]|nr:NACHT domain-containing protein [Microcoleus sp. PH2017_06_SFM_O_A]